MSMTWNHEAQYSANLSGCGHDDLPAAPRRSGRWIVASMLVALLLVAVWQQAWAAPIRRLGQNPRGLAMGNTGVSYANDEMALYYNPAGLGSIDNWWVELFPIAIEASDDAVDLVSDAGGSGFDNAATFIRENIGKDIALRAFYYPHVVANISPGFTFGASYFLEGHLELLLRNQATPEAEAFYREDKGSVLGLAFPIADGGILLGFSVRSINRTTAEGTISSADLALASASGTLDVEALLGAASGSGTGYDFGMIWRMESFAFLRGQFGLSVSNVGGTSFTADDANSTAPAEIPQEISFGWSFRPDFSRAIPVMFAIEMRDATKKLTTDSSTGKRTHFGLEVGFLPMDQATNTFTVRAGVNGDGGSFGVEFSLWHSFSIQYVIYYTEYGDEAGEDSRKRQILQFNLLGF